MPIPIYQVDSFSSSLFKGNPAAVCILDKPLPENLMQSIAAENNLSETAFVVLGERIKIRWFTPKVEVDLCGHATLAAAFILFKLYSTKSEFIFESKTESLKVWKEGNFLKMSFPLWETFPTDAGNQFLNIFGVQKNCVFDGDDGERNRLVLIPSLKELVDLQIDPTELVKCDDGRIVIATALGEEGDFDFACRVFAPSFGIDEDPVTGSAHCTLFPFWEKKFKKTKMLSKQVSKRTGLVYGEVSEGKVIIGGQACLYSQGEVLI